MNHNRGGFRASLYRDNAMMRPWIWSMGVLALIGPFLGWLGAVFSNSTDGRLQAAWKALYIVNYVGPLGVKHGRLIARLDQPTPFVVVHGFPVVAVGLLTAVMTLGVLLTAFEKERHYAIDAWMEPISRNASLHSKTLIGVSFVFGICIIRSALIIATVAMSPYHFASSAAWFDGLLNLTISLATLAIGMLAGTMMGNAFLGWCASFVFMLLPMVSQTVIDFYTLRLDAMIQSQTQRQFSLLDHLSPVMYTSIGARVVSAPPVKSTGGAWSSSLTFATYAQHPWWIASGAIFITILLLWVAKFANKRQSAERFSGWMTSVWGYRITTCIAAAEFGCLVALILQSSRGMHASIVWPLASVAGYLVIWLVKRTVEGPRRRTMPITQKG